MIYPKRLNLPVFLERETSVNSIALGIAAEWKISQNLSYDRSQGGDHRMDQQDRFQKLWTQEEGEGL